MRHRHGVLEGRDLTRFLALAILIRLVRDTSVRMLYPFLPDYADGLGISLTMAGTLLTVRTLSVLLAPYFGHLADRIGQRRLLIVGFGVQAAGLLGMSWARGFVTALPAAILLGLSDAIILPLMQAYVSEHAPSYGRGRALAIVEYAWAMTGIIMLPLVGWLIDAGGWNLPFRVIGLGSLAGALAFFWLMPPDVAREPGRGSTLRDQTATVFADVSAGAAVLVNAIIFIFIETFFILWGAHLDRDFSLNPLQISRVAFLIGLAELGGSVISSLTIERTGKRRGVIGGIGALVVVLVLMPLLDRTLPSLVAGMLLASMCLEYTVVTVIPLIGQQRPGSRATVLALAVTAAAVSRSITDTSATWVFENYGFLVAMGLALASLLAALWLLWRRVEERREV